MAVLKSRDIAEGICCDEPVVPPNEGKLYKSTWRNWFFLACVLLLTIIGLASAIPPLLSDRIVNPWPWIKTDYALLLGLSLIIIVFIGYITQQQRKVMQLHQKLLQMRVEAEERMRQHNLHLSAMVKLGRKMAAEIDLPSIFHSITSMCVNVFKCQQVTLMMYEKETDELVVRSMSGSGGGEIIDTRQRLGEGIAGWAAQRREALLLSGSGRCEKYPELKLENTSITSAMVVPIVVRSELVGVINVSSRTPEIKYTVEDLRTLQAFAEHTGAYIVMRGTESLDEKDDSHPAVRSEADEYQP